jgi:hypothetical protein
MVEGIGPSIDVPCIFLSKHKISSENRKDIKHDIKSYSKNSPTRKAQVINESKCILTIYQVWSSSQ